jgi:thiol-disulfide isomerase/thioredoxin
MTSYIILGAIILAASAFGIYRQINDGKTKVVDTRERVTTTDIGAEFGERVTLLQFSTAFCSPCRTTKVILSSTAELVPGVAHVEIDAESHLDLVNRLDIRRTPTTLILDAQGVVRNRAVGVPKKDELLTVIASVVDPA